jgi:hypothetical protein
MKKVRSILAVIALVAATGLVGAAPASAADDPPVSRACWQNIDTWSTKNNCHGPGLYHWVKYSNAPDYKGSFASTGATSRVSFCTGTEVGYRVQTL